MACAVDIGTCWIVGARQDANNQIQMKSIRDAFLVIENESAVKTMLTMSDVNYIETSDNLYIIGDSALTMASLLKRPVQRPMSKGVLAPGELEAEKILLILLENVLGKAKVQDEICFYSVPGNPVGAEMDIIYHQAILSKLLSQLGYKGQHMNEAAAIAFSNAAKEQFSALTISCLLPGQKVITGRGFINIEKIMEGDTVLNKDGMWVQCHPTSREYKGKTVKISAYGNGSIEVTEDHQIWINRSGTWKWIPAKDVLLGDLVMQPWPQFSFDAEKYICFEERITCSKPTNKALTLTSQMSELIGYFLGDGCMEYGDSNTDVPAGIGFTFDDKEEYNISRVKYLIEALFDKDAAVYPHGDSAVRIRMYSKGFSKWMSENCFDSNGVKVAPWNISDLSDNQLRYFMKGLIESDGSYGEEDGAKKISFENTSENLACFVYLAMCRLSMNPTFYVRDPRKGGIIGDRQIIGKKESYSIASSGIEAAGFLVWMKSPARSAKKSYNFGSCVAPVTGIGTSTYEGVVYDVSVLNGDPSFCVPGIAIHNCGAGMLNVCLMYKTMIGMSYSIVNSGDWVDASAAAAVGGSPVKLQAIKEKGLDLMNPEEGDPKTLREREAISIYYKSLILRLLDSLKNEFIRSKKTDFELPCAVPMIIAGGTSMAKNFLEFFKAAFETVRDKFPIPISEIKMASGNPLFSVAQGLLIAALNHEASKK